MLEPETRLIIRELTGTQLQYMVINGNKTLERLKEQVDALNVFPVPDGDTGTNMYLTMQSAAREVSALNTPTVSQVAAAASMGSLMGARGNSGVILSQLFRGFAKALEGKVTATAEDVAKGLQNGVDTAYKAVMKPVEGTILTVSRETAKAAVHAAKRQGDVLAVLENALQHGEEALARTPDLLPSLKQAGVVDAGGQGFLYIIRGWLAALSGEEIQLSEIMVEPVTAEVEHPFHDIEFQYCTEFILKGVRLDQDRIKQDLMGQGDCLLVVGTENVVKIHIHTDHPGRILEYSVELGSLHEVQIHNMREQSEAKRHAAKGEQFSIGPAASEPELKEMGIVAVVVGDGLVEIFRSLGVDEIIQGGQTMNPSTEDLVSAIKRIPANKVFVLPNNSNIILAAQQAKSLVDKEVHVVPTRSIPQGLAAVLAFDPEASFADNCAALEASYRGMKSGEVTYAVRDSQVDALQIETGDILGLIDDRIALTGEDPLEVTLQLVEKMGGTGADLISVFYGQDVDEAAANRLTAELRKRYPQSEVEVHSGGQPLYYYLVSVE